MSNQTTNNTWISAKEMAEKLCCTISNINALLRSGTISGHKTQSGWKVKRSDFENYMGDYVSILKAEEAVDTRRKELRAKEEEYYHQFYGLQDSIWFLENITQEFERIFSDYQNQIDESKRVSLADIIHKGWPKVVNEKSEEWNLSYVSARANISHNIRHFLRNLKLWPSYTKLLAEKDELNNRLATIERNYKMVIERLRAYDEKFCDSIDVEKNPILCKEVNNCDFSIRTMNCFRVANIDYVGQILNYTRADLLKYRNVGKRTIYEIEDFLKENGIEW